MSHTIIAGEGAELSVAKRCSNEPAIVTFLHHEHDVVHVELQFIFFLWGVGIGHSEPGGGYRGKTGETRTFHFLLGSDWQGCHRPSYCFLCLSMEAGLRLAVYP